MFKITQLSPAGQDWWAVYTLDAQSPRNPLYLPVATWALMADSYQQKVVGLVINPDTGQLCLAQEVKTAPNGMPVTFCQYQQGYGPSENDNE